MNILITGATGYLGSKLTNELLKSGHIIHCTIRDTVKINKQRLSKNTKIYEIEKIEINDIFRDNKIDCIIHCATNYGRGTKNNLLEMIDANIYFPLKILLAAKKYKVKYFINTDTALQSYVSEYSFTKKQFLNWLIFFSKDITVVNILLEHFYGPKDKESKFINYMINKLIKNKDISIPLTKGNQRRDFIYIDDVLSAYQCIIANLEKLDNKFNNISLGSNELISIKNLAIMIKDKCNNSKSTLKFGALPSRKSEQDSNADLTFITSLGWRKKYTLEKGIINTIELSKN